MNQNQISWNLQLQFSSPTAATRLPPQETFVGAPGAVLPPLDFLQQPAPPTIDQWFYTDLQVPAPSGHHEMQSAPHIPSAPTRAVMPSDIKPLKSLGHSASPGPWMSPEGASRGVQSWSEEFHQALQSCSKCNTETALSGPKPHLHMAIGPMTDHPEANVFLSAIARNLSLGFKSQLRVDRQNFYETLMHITGNALGQNISDDTFSTILHEINFARYRVDEYRPFAADLLKEQMEHYKNNKLRLFKTRLRISYDLGAATIRDKMAPIFTLSDKMIADYLTPQVTREFCGNEFYFPKRFSAVELQDIPVKPYTQTQLMQHFSTEQILIFREHHGEAIVVEQMGYKYVIPFADLLQSQDPIFGLCRNVFTHKLLLADDMHRVKPVADGQPESLGVA